MLQTTSRCSVALCFNGLRASSPRANFKYLSTQSQNVRFSSSSKNDWYSHTFSKNMKLFTQYEVSKLGNYQVLNEKAPHRPLILLYTWLNAKEKHVMKFVNLYMEKGLDVLAIGLTPMELLQPQKKAHVIVGTWLKFLHENPSFNPLLVHGLSVGGYHFFEGMAHVSEDMSTHGVLMKRFAGQVWDSVIDMEGVSEGISRTAPDVANLQKLIEKFLNWYLDYKYKTVTFYLQRASQMMQQNIIRAPTLFIYSTRDPVSTPKMNKNFYARWPTDIHVVDKCFNNSPHVCHYAVNPKEYDQEVTTFLKTVGVLKPT